MERGITFMEQKLSSVEMLLLPILTYRTHGTSIAAGCFLKIEIDKSTLKFIRKY